MWLGPPPALYPDLQRRRASTALQGFLEWRAGSDIQSSGPMWTRSRCENCLAKSSKLIQNSPSFLTRTLSSSLSRSLRESHSQLRSDHGPFHSPRPQGFLSLTCTQSDVSTRGQSTSCVATDQVSVPQLAPHPRQPRHAVGVSGHQPIPQPGLPLV